MNWSQNYSYLSRKIPQCLSVSVDQRTSFLDLLFAPIAFFPPAESIELLFSALVLSVPYISSSEQRHKQTFKTVPADLKVQSKLQDGPAQVFWPRSVVN